MDYLKKIGSEYRKYDSQECVFERTLNLSSHVDALASEMQNSLQKMLSDGYITLEDVAKGKVRAKEKFEAFKREIDELENEFNREYDKYL